MGQAEDAKSNRLRTWDPEEWAEDERYVAAMDLLVAGNKHDALRKLIQLYEDDPRHLFARRELFTLALEVGENEQVKKHIEWIITFYAQRGELQDLCATYRSTRVALPNLEWTERTLVHALIAGDKAHEGRVVVDATKMLLANFPQSAALPRAFIASADVQLHEGRPDLARVTLKNVIARFPLDPLVQMAERKLQDLPETP